MRHNLADLIDMDECQRLLDSFCAVVGVAAAIVDLDGRVLIGSRWQRICTGFHRVNSLTSSRCVQSDTSVTTDMLHGKKFSLYRCGNGLTDAASPIIIEGQHVANAFIGQFLLGKPDVEFFSAQAAEFGFDKKEYLSALSDVPVFSEANLQPILFFLTTLAETIASLGLKQLRQIKTEKELREAQDELETRIRSRTAELEARNLELRLSEEYFRRTFDQGPIGAAILGLDSRIQRVNPALCHTLGYSGVDLIGHSLIEFCHPEDVKRETEAFENLKSCVTGCESIETRLVRKDGRAVWTSITVRVMRDAAGEPLYLFPMIEDISERRRSEEMRARLAAIVESSEDAIIGRDLEGVVTSWNSGAETIFGYTTEEMMGRTLSALVPPDRREENEELFNVLKSRKNIRNLETVRLTKKGNRIHVCLNLTPILDGSGKMIGIASTSRDITEEKSIRLELESYTAKLERSNKSLQEFAYVASHDLQEPLRKIMVFGERLVDQYRKALDERGRDYLDRMTGAAARMSTLIEKLLEYSRISTRLEPFRPVDLNDVLRDVLGDLEVLIEKEKGTVGVGELPVIEADPLQVRQLFQNLIGNALKFHNERSPEVRVEATAIDGGDYYQILVKDNGIGFDEKFVDRIFGPFQRLHDRTSRYPGTGIGLAICRKIVERHGGNITAKSVEGEGSEFMVTMPARQKPASVRRVSGRDA